MSTFRDVLESHSKIIKTKQASITPGFLRCSRHRDCFHAKLELRPNDDALKLILLDIGIFKILGEL